MVSGLENNDDMHVAPRRVQSTMKQPIVPQTCVEAYLRS